MANLKDLIVSGVGRFVDKVYASEFIGKLTGNADTATKATQDGSGNVITSTYATKTELANKSDSVKHTISQTDIVAGTTPLTAGELYLVYE